MKKIMLLTTLIIGSIIIFLYFFTAQKVDKKDYYGVYSKAKIYFIIGGAEYHIPIISAEAVRKSPKLYIEIYHQDVISDITKVIFTDDFIDTNGNYNNITTLVIDFIRPDGTIESIYANNKYMYNKDYSKYKKMDNKLVEIICSYLHDITGIGKVK